jgi:hypothetical protein
MQLAVLVQRDSKSLKRIGTASISDGSISEGACDMPVHKLSHCPQCLDTLATSPSLITHKFWNQHTTLHLATHARMHWSSPRTVYVTTLYVYMILLSPVECGCLLNPFPTNIGCSTLQLVNL